MGQLPGLEDGLCDGAAGYVKRPTPVAQPARTLARKRATQIAFPKIHGGMRKTEYCTVL